MVNYGSSLREKEENFDNLCCESSQPTVEYHEYGLQDSNKVETKMNLDAGKTRPPRKQQRRQRQQQQQSCVNTP